MGLSNDIDVWAPDTDQPLVSPIIYMVGGFGGLLPGSAYYTVLNRYCTVNISYHFNKTMSNISY